MARNFSTRAIHDGEEWDKSTGAHNTPIYQTATFSFATAEDMAAAIIVIRDCREAGRLVHRVMNPGADRRFAGSIAPRGDPDRLAPAIERIALRRRKLGFHFYEAGLPDAIGIFVIMDVPVAAFDLVPRPFEPRTVPAGKLLC